MNQNNFPKLESVLKKATVKPRKLFYLKLTLKLYVRIFFAAFKNLMTPAWKPALSLAAIFILVFNIFYFNSKQTFAYHLKLARHNLNELDGLVSGKRKIRRVVIIPFAYAEGGKINEAEIIDLTGKIIFHTEEAMEKVGGLEENKKIALALFQVDDLNIKEIKVFGKTATVIENAATAKKMGIALDIASSNMNEVKKVFEENKTILLSSESQKIPRQINIEPTSKNIKRLINPEEVENFSLPSEIRTIAPISPVELNPAPQDDIKDSAIADFQPIQSDTEKINDVKNSAEQNLAQAITKEEFSPVTKELSQRYLEARQLLKENQVDMAYTLLNSVSVETRLITGDIKSLKESVKEEFPNIEETLPGMKNLKEDFNPEPQELKIFNPEIQEEENRPETKLPESQEGIDLKENKDLDNNEIKPETNPEEEQPKLKEEIESPSLDEKVGIIENVKKILNEERKFNLKEEQQPAENSDNSDQPKENNSGLKEKIEKTIREPILPRQFLPEDKNENSLPDHEDGYNLKEDDNNSNSSNGANPEPQKEKDEQKDINPDNNDNNPDDSNNSNNINNDNNSDSLKEKILEIRQSDDDKQIIDNPPNRQLKEIIPDQINDEEKNIINNSELKINEIIPSQEEEEENKIISPNQDIREIIIPPSEPLNNIKDELPISNSNNLIQNNKNSGIDTSEKIINFNDQPKKELDVNFNLNQDIFIPPVPLDEETLYPVPVPRPEPENKEKNSNPLQEKNLGENLNSGTSGFNNLSKKTNLDNPDFEKNREIKSDLKEKTLLQNSINKEKIIPSSSAKLKIR